MTDLLVSEKGMNVVKAFEGCPLRAYYCSAGVLTIGWGNTNADPTVMEVLGRPITPGMTITQEQADRMFEISLQRRYRPAVVAVLGSANKQEYIDAGTCFHYNTGAVKRASWPKSLLAGDMTQAKASLLSWNKGAGKVLAGLVRRRAREWAIISTGDYGPEGVGKKRKTSSGRVVPEGTGFLDKGDSGPEVKELQGWLIQLGLLPKGSDSGTFDDATFVAVCKFQGGHPQLTRDGVVGPATREALRRAVALQSKAGGTIGKVGGSGTAVGTATGAAFSVPIAKVILISTAVVVVGVLIYLAWKYKDEVMARVNRALGREVK
jgi:lysozyme